MIWDFHFLRPWWLLGLAFAALLLIAASRRNDLRSRWSDMIAPRLLDHLLISGTQNGRFQPYHLAALVIALGSLAVAGPTWQRERPPFVADNAALVIAVDLSPTMNAIDITPSRLERAKLKIHDVVALRKGARTALVAYSGSAHLVLPLTEDAALIDTYVDALQTRIMPDEGRSMAKALALADKVLADGAERGTVLVLTDAIDDSAFSAGSSGGKNGLIVLGIATPEGGPVKGPDGGFLSDAAGARLFPKLDIAAFNRLKSETNADVATVSTDDRDVTWINDRIRTHFEQQIAEGTSRWKDMGWWLVVVLVPVAALFFRKGWVIRWTGVVLAAHLAFAADQARADDWRPIDAFLTPDQQGRRAFEQGDFIGATSLFHDPMWRGTAFYRAGKYAEAVDAFAQAQIPESDFNQGNALIFLKKYDEAVAAYTRALAKRKNWPAAKANLAIAEALAKKQKQDDEEQAQDPNEKPDQFQFDDKGKKGKAGTMEIGEQTSDLWMKNIVVSPTDLLARKFAIEARGAAK
ncbi:VWA domain-containing protein [Rhizobium sp. KVB221]|uniref:VWA domain-containing protein n=1 Tax=Rhizobium setariae TaxID=2801340 RepID=A0A936YJV5_9HYPH|nr:VWA domain-containing protein [Rhizobium setariae]MBL0371533.1 VWA domain-containing protein [Rhizobium setariae]